MIAFILSCIAINPVWFKYQSRKRKHGDTSVGNIPGDGRGRGRGAITPVWMTNPSSNTYGPSAQNGGYDRDGYAVQRTAR